MRANARLLVLPLLTAAAVAQTPSVPLGTIVAAPFTDLRWQVRHLRDLGATHATVVWFATNECPLVQRYLPRVGQIAADYAPRGVVTLVVNVGAGDAFVDAVGEVVKKAPTAVFGKDVDLRLANACGVERTATAVVLDREHRIVYRGRIDDQHGYSASRARATRDDLRIALDEVLAGSAVSVASTEASGCRITPPAAPSGPAPSWARDIAPLVQKHCVECHRPDGEAPFPLLTPAHAQKHANMIGEVVAQRRMPPWYGSSAHGTFANRRGLDDRELALVTAWVAAGAHVDDPKAELPPPPPRPAGGWRIGKPDLVLSMKAPTRLPAEGPIPYQYLLLPFRFEHDTWVEAVEIRPQNERVLHHCNLARVKWGEKFSQDGFITGYVPGGDPLVMDPGIAVRIPAGSALVLQAHYVATGEPEQDRLQVGLRFPRQRVEQEMQVAIAADFRFAIPPGAAAHPVRASRTLREDAVGIGMFVHMHLRGRDMIAMATAPDGSEETLLLVPNYNFDWQQSYRWPAGTKTFAKGTRITALAHFDNSTWNPFNPDPTVTVRFGQETTDEMMYLFLFWVAKEQRLGLEVDPTNGRVVPAPGR